MSASNNLFVETLPPELELTDLEMQMIAKTILFMKIRQLPRSGMDGISDKVINVPIQDDDISATVSTFPRNLEEAAIVPVKLKRRIAQKNAYKEQLVRPNKLICALK